MHFAVLLRSSKFLPLMVIQQSNTLRVSHNGAKHGTTKPAKESNIYMQLQGEIYWKYIAWNLCDKPQHKIVFVCNFPHNNYYVCSCSFVIFHPYHRPANSCQTTDLNECLSKHTLRIKVRHQMTFPVERANLIQRLIEESLRN